MQLYKTTWRVSLWATVECKKQDKQKCVQYAAFLVKNDKNLMYGNIWISRELYVCREVFGRMYIRLCWVFLFVSQIHSLPSPTSSVPWTLTLMGCIYGPAYPLASGWFGMGSTSKRCERGRNVSSGYMPLASFLPVAVAAGRCPPFTEDHRAWRGASRWPFSLFYNLYFWPFKPRGLSALASPSFASFSWPSSHL